MNEALQRRRRGGAICLKMRLTVSLHSLQLCSFPAAPLARPLIHPACSSPLSPTDGAAAPHESVGPVNWVKGKQKATAADRRRPAENN